MNPSCDFCFRRCCLSEGQKGYCGARENIEGKIVSVNYGQLVSLALDPVEKKPLYHFLPHTKTLSVSQSGCNYSCLFCQNWEISQKIVKEEETDPSSLAAYCLRYGVPAIRRTVSQLHILRASCMAGLYALRCRRSKEERREKHNGHKRQFLMRSS